MKKILVSALVVLMVGCSSTPPPPPEPKGKLTPVNPTVVYLNKLYTK